MFSSNPRDWVIEPHQTETLTVVLHGKLAKQFGRRHTLGVHTAVEAIHALCALHPGFREAFQPGSYRVIRGSVAKGMPLSENMLGMKIGGAGEVHFMPVAAGRKRGAGIGKIILGVVIIIVAIILTIPSGGTSWGAAAAAVSGGLAAVGISAGSLAFFGASMILAGISQVISPQPKSNNGSSADQRASFGISGAFNSVSEGSAVPIVYGRQRVGSVVGSFGYSAEDYFPAGYFNTSGSVGVFGEVPNLTTTPTGLGGGGKGGGGGSNGATEAPNTLRSNAIVRVIDILSEGPIGGLVNGAKSIFFNGTPLQAADGTYNFKGVTWEVRLGYPDQTPIKGYPSVEQTLSSELGLPFGVKKANGPKIITINSAVATALRVTTRIPALVTQDAKTGNLIAGPRTEYQIEVQPQGGVWTTAVIEHLVGQKCVAPFQRSFRFDLPGATDSVRQVSWNVRMTRLSDDDTSVNTHSETFLDAITLITDHQLTYSNTAYIALTIDAAAFGSQVPTRAYEIDGMICQVPLNYDPDGHFYNTTGPGTSMGSWDGASWKPAVTNNPAWCLYDLLSNPRYGMGLPARTLTATRYDLFPISQYCDGKVPSGFKDPLGADILELRFCLNVAMATQEDAYRVIQAMVSSFRGLTYWGAGRVVVTADMPTQPSSVLNQTNVIDGAFSYEGTDLKSRHTVARVAWQDPANSYRTAIEVYEDFDAVVSQGQVPADIQGFGCTSRGMARRLGKWLLETEKHQTETVSARTGLEHLRVRPGDVVKVSDPAFVGQVMGGRCAAGSNTTAIILDRVLEGPSDLTYSVTVSLPDGTVETQPCGVSNNIPGSTILSLGGALSQAPAADASWVLTSTGTAGAHGGVYAIEPRQFRIAGVMEQQRGQFSIIGLLHDPNKYARVEYGLQFDPTPYSALGSILATPMPPPTSVFARSYMTGVGSTTIIRATVSCTVANDPRVVGTQFRAAGPEQRSSDTTSGSSVDFDGLQIGTYVFGARSVGRDGRTSAWVDAPALLVDGIAAPPNGVNGLTAQGGAMCVNIDFTASDARDLLHYELWRSPAPANGVHPFNLDGFTPSGPPTANGASLVASFDSTHYHDASDLLGPDKGWAYWVRPINTTLAAGAFSGPVKAKTTYYLVDNLDVAIRNTAVYAQALLGSAPTIVSDLLTAGSREGQLIFNTSDQKLYVWNATNQAWTAFIPLVPDSSGKLTTAQSAAVTQATISGSLTPAQTQALIAGISAGGITSDKIASLTGDKVTGTMANATLLASTLYDAALDSTGTPIPGTRIPGVNASRLVGTIQGSVVTGTLPNATLLGSTIRDVDPLTSAQVVGLQAARIAGQLVAGQISAGAITTEKLAVGSPDNVIANSCFAYSSDGWAGMTVTPVLGTALEANYAPTTDGAGLAVTGPLAPQAFNDLWYNAGRASALAYNAPIPCTAGETWEAQICFLPVSGTVEVLVIFSDANGGIPSSPRTGAQTYPVPANGQKLSSWMTIGARGVAPANAVAVTVLVRLTNVSTVTAPASAYLTRALLGRTVPNATALLGWVPGGVTSIGGGLLQTNSIQARSIKANQIGAREIAVGNSSNLIWNSCLAVSTDGWSVYASGTSAAILGSCSSTYQSYQTPDGCGNVILTLVPGDYADLAWQAITCAPGETLEYQVMILPIGCQASAYLTFINSAGTLIGYTPFATAIPAQGGPVAAQVGGLEPFQLLAKIEVVPAGASRARLAIRFSSTNVSACVVIFTRASLGRTFTGATQISPWAPGGITTISGGILATSSVVTRTIAAGAIQAEKLAIASAANVIWNSTCPSTSSGWLNFSNATGSILGSVTGDNIAPSSFALAGLGTGCITAPSLSPAQGLFVVWDPNNSNGIQTMPGEWWEASAYLSAHRCVTRVRIEFLTSAGVQVANNQAVGDRIAGPMGGSEQSGYGFSWAKGQVPVGATRARLVIDGFNDNGADIVAGVAGTNPYVFFTKVLLGPSTPTTRANGAQPQPWQPGGVTQISGGMIQTSAITARTISAGAIDASKLSVGSPTNLIWNSCCSQSAAGWQGGVGVLDQSSAYALAGFGTGFLNMNLANGQIADISWAPNNGADGSTFKYDGVHSTIWGEAVPCTPGVLMEAQAKVTTHRCAANLYLLFMGINPANGLIGLIAPYATGEISNLPLSSAKTVGDYTQLSIRGMVPAGASLCTLMIRMNNSALSQAVFGASSGQNAFLFFTQAALGTALPNVPAPMPWGPGGTTIIDGGMVKTASISALQLAAGSIIAGKIQAGAIRAGDIGAGAIVTQSLAVASATNVIWNACWEETSAGWVYASATGFSTSGMVAGTAYDPAWKLQASGTGVMAALSPLALGQNMDTVWDPRGGFLGVPVMSGLTYEAQAKIIAINVGVTVIIEFVDGAGNAVGAANGNRISGNSSQYGGGGLNLFALSSVKALAPSTAVRARMYIRATQDGGANSVTTAGQFAFFTQALFGLSVANSIEPQPWMPGGVTSIDGGVIKTGTVNADRINTGTLVAGSGFIQALTATTVTAATVKAVLINANKLTAASIDVDNLTVGAVKAGAIGSDQIAAGQIHAIHLAADFVLATSAQIGTAVIGTAQIGNLILGTDFIGAGAITRVTTGTIPVFTGGVHSCFVTGTVPPSGNTGIVLWFRIFFNSDPPPAYVVPDGGAFGGEGGAADGGGGGI